MYRTNAIMVATYKEIKRTILCEPKIQVVRAYKNPLKIRGQIICGIGCEKGPTPGGYQETAVIADEPDVLDGGNGVEGIGGGGLATGWRVRRVAWWFLYRNYSYRSA
jgi:hypothetical protein